MRPKDEIAAHELLHGILDPLGRSGGPARTYDASSPISLALQALRNQKAFAMDRDSAAAKALDELICDLRLAARRGPHDPAARFWGLWKLTTSRLEAWAAGRPPADGERSRLRALADNACKLLREWAAEIESCPHPCGHERHLRKLLMVASVYLLADDRASNSHPVISSVKRMAINRIHAGRLLDGFCERPHLGAEDHNGRDGRAKREDDAECEPMIYVAVVNQVKGDEFDWVVICALKPERFPYGFDDSYDERCRWWVAISRGREGTSFFGVPDNDMYWPPRCAS